MGSCEANGNGIDPTVGGLVWVRRRNGSWWPGRILGPDELPESCLVSPRSGTPVKLLGREDASVDWYNLEKSKRVKAFRCGEYDECIEKAKSSATYSSKKAVKYARREDAILHALEIENATRAGPAEEIKNSNSDKLEEEEEEWAPPPPMNDLEEEEEEEEDGIEKGKKKRMRGLKDIGGGGGGTHKRRRRRTTQVAAAHVNEFLKKKNRRRQLTKVLESTAMVSVPVMCEKLKDNSEEEININNNNNKNIIININNKNVNNNNNNDHSDDDCKRKENESVVENEDNSSIRLFDVPFIREGKQNSEFSPIPEKPEEVNAGAHSGQSSLVETVSVGPTDEVQESGSISSGAAAAINGHGIDNKSTSKWQHKGKRNLRNKSKNLPKYLNIDTLQQVIKEDNQIVESTRAPPRLMPYRQSRFTVNPKYEFSCLTGQPKYESSSLTGQPKYEHSLTDQPKYESFCLTGQPKYESMCLTGQPNLYDVNIEVDTGHRPAQHVPYISLMSKLTGKPIIGHPVIVEVLVGPVTDLWLNGPTTECCHSSSGGELTGQSKKPRRNGVLLNKKIRKLSSLTGSKKPSETGKFKKPGLACVPLSVVFGRINAALGIVSAGPTS